jgi:hypothetical protein
MSEPDPKMAPADLIAELERSGRMQADTRAELLSQTVLAGRKELPPTVYVGSAEGRAFFRGLNHGRNLVGPIDDAVQEIGKDPASAETRYAALLKKFRPRNRRPDERAPGG